MANEVANLVVEISADAKKLNTALANSEIAIKGFATRAAANLKIAGLALAGLGVAGIAGAALLVRKLNETTKALDDLGDTASSIGLTTKELQRLQFQAEQAGSSAQDVAQSFVFMENAVADGARGAQQQADAFNKLGLNVQLLKQLRPEQQFEQIAEAFKKIKNVNDQTDLARTIFGRGGISQINLLNSKLQESKKLFEDFGLGLNDQQAQNVDELDKSRKLLGSIFEDFGNKTAAGVAPAFDALNKGITKTIKDFGGLGGTAEFISKGIIKAFGAIADSAVVLHKPFKALDTLFEGVKLAGTSIGVTAAQLVHGQQVGKAAFRGEVDLPLPGSQSSKDLQSAANDIRDTQAKKLDDALLNYGTIDKNSVIEVALNNVADAFKTSGNEADKAKDKVKSFQEALDAAANSSDALVKKTKLEESVKKSGASFDDEESAFLNKLKGYSDAVKPKTEEQLRDSIVSKLSALNTPESNQAVSDIFKSFGAKNYAERNMGKRGSPIGEIWDENGKYMSAANQQNIVVTVVLVPDEGRLFNAVVDSQIFRRAMTEETNKNLIEVARSDRS